MEYCQDNNAVFLRTKINTVWKTIGDDAPNVLANNGKLVRMLRRPQYAAVNFGHELKSKAKPLAFIPCTCFNELSAGGAMKSD